MLDAFGAHDFTSEYLVWSISLLYRVRCHGRSSPTRAAISDGRLDMKNSRCVMPMCEFTQETQERNTADFTPRDLDFYMQC